jgi:hypothetical protein
MVTYAVVLTHDRPELAIPLIQSLITDGVRPIVVDNGDVPIPELPGSWSIHVPMQPPNISALWNLGLDVAADIASVTHTPQYDIAVLNDDLIVPPGSIQQLGLSMRAYGTDAAFPDVHGGVVPQATVWRSSAYCPINLFHRMAGFCFVLRGEARVRADEQFQFWYGDDDLDWRLRAGNGTVQVPLRDEIKHLRPNESAARPELAKIAGEDRERFYAKYSQYPW